MGGLPKYSPDIVKTAAWRSFMLPSEAQCWAARASRLLSEDFVWYQVNVCFLPSTERYNKREDY